MGNKKDNDPIWLETWVESKIGSHLAEAEILKRILKIMKDGKS